MIEPDSNPDFLVAGATARPVARSIAKAGFSCRAIDLFADWDTQAICDVQQADSMENVERRIVETLTNERLVLGSGGENFSFVHDKSNESFASIPSNTLFGSSRESIKRARDPFFLYEAIRDEGLPALPVQLQHPTDDKQWIWKPFRSGGGRGVQLASKSTASFDGKEGFFQQFGRGLRLIGVVYLSNEFGCRPVAFADQFGGQHDPFCWKGACSMSLIAKDCRDRMENIGKVVAERAGLVGWFGIDFVSGSEDGPLLLEVNPRYTATMEIWERQTGQSIFALHQAVCNGTPPNELNWDSFVRKQGFMMKSYLLNLPTRSENSSTRSQCNTEARPLHVTEDIFQSLVNVADENAMSFITDIPNVGSRIGPNDPVCTMWVTGAPDQESAIARTCEFENEILNWFGSSYPC